MNCIYINVDGQIARQESVEANFASINQSNWSLTRLSAIDTNHVQNACIKGKATDRAKACLLSHQKAISLSTEMAGHTMIVEDDVLFGKNSFHSIDRAINEISSNDWDFIFTDVCVPNLQAMIELYFLRRQLIPNHQVKLLPLKTVPFAGSTAYVVNSDSKEKILAFFSENQILDIPYDLWLRDLIYKSELSALLIFPFVTSLSPYADVSQIQPDDNTKITDLAWNAFRRIMWSESVVDEALTKIDLIPDAFFDPECRAFSKILSCMLSVNFTPK